MEEWMRKSKEQRGGIPGNKSKESAVWESARDRSLQPAKRHLGGSICETLANTRRALRHRR